MSIVVALGSYENAGSFEAKEATAAFATTVVVLHVVVHVLAKVADSIGTKARIRSDC